MIKDKKYISLVTKDDYLRSAGSIFGTFFYRSGDISAEATAWTDSGTTGSIWVRSTPGTAGGIRPVLGYLMIGDSIDFEGEFLAVTGVVSMRLEYATNPDFTGYTLEESLFPIQGLDNSFRRKVFRFNIKKNGYYRLYFGCIGETVVAEYKVRNIAIRANSTPKVFEDSNMRRAVIQKQSGTFVKRSDFAGDSCTITTETDNTVVVTFTKPLFGLRPVPFVDGDYFTATNKYIVRCDFAVVGSVKVRFYAIDTWSDTPVLLSALPNNIQFSIMLMG